MSEEYPSVYDLAELTEDRARYWLAIDAWSHKESAALLCAVDPNLLIRLNGLTVGFPLQFDTLSRMLERASEVGVLTFPAKPMAVIGWAKGKGLRLPAPFHANLSEPATDTQPTSDIAILSPSFAKLQKAISDYPSTYSGKTPKLDDDVRPWLRSSYGCTVRESEVFGAILAEHFGLR